MASEGCGPLRGHDWRSFLGSPGSSPHVPSASFGGFRRTVCCVECLFFSSVGSIVELLLVFSRRTGQSVEYECLSWF